MKEEREDKKVAIKLSGVKKMYRLGQIGGGTLQADLQSWWARVRHKEDPNTQIGQEQRLVGQTFMALNGIDLTIYKGEAVGIIGGNGAGKSTLLKLLSRVTAPTEGEIDLYGRVASMLEVGTGFNPEMTGRENIYMNGAILGMTKAEIDAKMEQIIEFSEVGDFIDTPVKRYSSGMYVKLAFSVSAHLEAEIMIMDEVLAVGDMAFQQKCLKKMSEAATEQGKTVLYVSHNMNTIRQLCSRCIVLEKGRKIFDGDTEEAIRIYMVGDSEQRLPVAYDFSKVARTHQFGQKIKITGFYITDRESAVFEAGDNVKYKICISSVIEQKGVKTLLTVENQEGRRIGMAISDSFDVMKGENQAFTFVAPLSNLAQGAYSLGAEIVYCDDRGNYYSFDNPGRRVYIQYENEHAHGIHWVVKSFGNINLGKICRIEE